MRGFSYHCYPGLRWSGGGFGARDGCIVIGGVRELGTSCDRESRLLLF
jgi:hypothetical protein